MLGGTALGTGENRECHPWEARLGAGQAGLGIAWSGKHSSFQSAAGPALGREGEAARSLHRHPRRRCAGSFISLWGPCRGAGAGSLSRSSQPAGIRRECAAQDARLSLRSSGTRGLGTDHTHNLPGSRGSGVTGLLFPRGWKCVRGIKARGLKEGLNIFVLKLSEPRNRAHTRAPADSGVWHCHCGDLGQIPGLSVCAPV